MCVSVVWYGCVGVCRGGMVCGCECVGVGVVWCGVCMYVGVYVRPSVLPP